MSSIRGVTRRRAVLVTVAAGVAALVCVAVVRVGESTPVQATATATVSTPRPTPSAAPSKQKIHAIGTPDRLTIPAIGVKAAVVPVGTTAEGAQEVPPSFDVTGWWKDGRQPGQSGNAVIVGHTASKSAGVFDNLSDLKKGDTIAVSSGSEHLTYTVTGEQEVRNEKFGAVADQIYRRVGPSGVVLLTCGDWNGSRFEATVIVTARVA